MRNVEQVIEHAKRYSMTPGNINKLLAHLEREKVRIPELSNRDLFDEYSGLLPGDDYDGCFTHDGEISMALLSDEIEKRLASWLEG